MATLDLRPLAILLSGLLCGGLAAVGWHGLVA